MILYPNDFSSDWYGFITNQSGHAYLVGFPMSWGLSFFVSPSTAVISVAVSYFIIWEFGVQKLSNIVDAIEDASHVAIGSAVAFTMWGYTSWGLWPYTIQAVGLTGGAVIRARRRGRQGTTQEG